VTAIDVGLELAAGRLQLVDLSQPIYQGMPVFPGHLKTVMWDFHTHEETARLDLGFSYRTKGVMLSDHGPSHVDAPNHVDPDPGAASIDELPLSLFITPAIAVDCTALGPGDTITREAVEEKLGTTGQTLPNEGTVLLWTGHHDRCYGTSEWLGDHAGTSRDLMEWLDDSGVVNVGIDAPSIDSPSTRYPGHQVCRERGLLNTENLANLGSVVGREFTWVGLPLPMQGATGSPIRAVALLSA
jgi:kynurenine formamidase